MILRIFTVSLLLFGTILSARDITTNDGTTYRDVEIAGVNPNSIQILTSGKIVDIPFSELPQSIKDEFGYSASRDASFQASVPDVTTQQDSNAPTPYEEQDNPQAPAAGEPSGDSYMPPSQDQQQTSQTINIDDGAGNVYPVVYAAPYYYNNAYWYNWHNHWYPYHKHGWTYYGGQWNRWHEGHRFWYNGRWHYADPHHGEWYHGKWYPHPHGLLSPAKAEEERHDQEHRSESHGSYYHGEGGHRR